MTETEVKPEVKVEVEVTEPTLDEKVVKQVEYYFGDVNLPHDKFIKLESAKNNGWFPVNMLLKFNKLNSILDMIPEDNRVSKIVEALKTSVLVELDEETKNVRRCLDIPLPEGNPDSRTVYLKGFHKTETKLDTLIDHFKQYEGFEAVIMRHYKEKILLADLEDSKKPAPVKDETPEKKEESDVKAENGNVAEPEKKTYTAGEDKVAYVKKFKGSIFVVFKTPELAKAAMDAITTYGGATLLKMIQTDYKTMKNKEWEARVESRNAKKRKAEVPVEKAEAEAESEDEAEEERPKGVLIKLSGIPNGYTREVIKEKWYAVTDTEKFKVAFVDFQKGDTEGVLRLSRDGAAQEAFDLLKDGQITVEENVNIKVEVPDAEFETSYQDKIKDDRNKSKRFRGDDGQGRGRGGGRGRGRGGRRGGRGRGGRRGGRGRR